MTALSVQYVYSCAGLMRGTELRERQDGSVSEWASELNAKKFPAKVV